MPTSPVTSLLTLALLTTTSLRAQQYSPLDFYNHVQETNGMYPNMSTLGPEYYYGTSFDFSGVTTVDGQSIDARVTLTGTSGSYEPVGWLPHYNQQDDDLGAYYRYTGDSSQPTGGVSFTLTFYQGDGSFSTVAELDAFRILIYDHDGEPGQSETVTITTADGFTGYQLHNDSGITASSGTGNTWDFDARGENHDEETASGGFIAYYENTSSISFSLTATTSPDLEVGKYGIFTGFDGNLSLTDIETSGFGSFVAVPEPTACALASLGGLALTLRRRRHRR